MTNQLEPTRTIHTDDESSLPFANVRARLCAALLDLVAIYLLLFLIIIPLGRYVENRSLARVVEDIFLIAIPWIYFAGFESSSWMATPGKMRARVIVTDAQGKRISFARASIRFLAKLPILATIGLALIVASFDRQKRALDDWIAGTRVRSVKTATSSGRIPIWGRGIGPAIALVALSFIAYFYYSIATGKDRVTQICSEIKPGMSVQEVAAFARKKGLGPGSPKPGVKLAYLAELRSYGRHACKVEFEEGVVTQSTYNFAD